MWIVKNQASLAVHICRIIATAAQDDRVYDFKNHLEPGGSWHFPDEDRPFLVYGVFNDGHNAIEANAINQAANIDTAAMVLGVGSLILGGIALLFPPTAPLAVALVITGTAAALTSTGLTVGSDVVSLRQGVDDTIVGAVLIKFPGLSGRHDVELVISGGYKLGRIGNDPRPIAYDVKPLTIEWTDSSTNPVQQGMVESDVWPPFSSTQATSGRPIPQIYPRMEPTSFNRVRLSEGWHDVNAMCTMETSIYTVQAGSLYRVSPNNGCAELLIGSDELATNTVGHSGEIVGFGEMVGLGNHLYIQVMTRMDGHERLDLIKLDAFGRPGRVTVYHGFANGLLRGLKESGGFPIDEQVGFENYYQWILPGDQLDASGKVPAAGQVSSRGILEWCSPYGRLPFGAGRLFPGSLNMSRSDDAGVGAAESDLPADDLSVTLHTRDIRSMTVVGDAVILNDGLIHRLTGDGVLHGGFHNMHVAGDLVQPFGKLEGTETGIFVQILDDENGEDSGTVHFFPSLGTTEPLVLKLGQIESLVWSRPFLYFLRRGGGGGESLSICSVEVNEHGPTSTEVVELYHLNSPGKSVTQMVTLGGSLFTLEDGVLHRTRFEAHDRLLGADRPPPRV